MSMSNNRNTAPPDGKILKALFRIVAVVVFLDAVVNIIICLSGDDTDTVSGARRHRTVVCLNDERD